MIGGKKFRKGKNGNGNGGGGNNIKNNKNGKNKGKGGCECNVLLTSSTANPVERLNKIQDAVRWINDFANRAIRINEAKRLLEKAPSELLPSVTARARELINIHESMQTYIKSVHKQLEDAQKEGAQKVMSEKFTNADVPGAAIEDENELQRLLMQHKLMYGSIPISIYLSTQNNRLRTEAINGMRDRLSLGSTSKTFNKLLYDMTNRRFFALYTSPTSAVYVAFRMTDMYSVSDVSVLDESRLSEFMTDSNVTLMPSMHEDDVMVNVLGMSGTPLSPVRTSPMSYGGGFFTW